jgi:UPF0755 protein
VSRGNGPGGYPGRGYGGPDYEGGPGRGGQEPGDDSVWRNDQGYRQDPGHPRQPYGEQSYGDQSYGDQSYGDQSYGDQSYGGQGSGGYDPRGYGQQNGAGPGYPRQNGYAPPDRGDDGWGRQGSGPRPVQSAYGGRDGYAGYEQQPGDSSFLPGFGGRDDFDDSRPPGRGRDDRYDDDDYDGGRGQRTGRPGGRGATGPGGGRGPGDRGPGARGPGDWDRGDQGRGDQGRGDQGRGDWGQGDGQAPRGRGDGPRDRDDWGDTYDRNPKPRKKATRWAPRILILVVFIALVAGGLVGGLSIYHKYQSRYHPADFAGPGTGDVTVQVKSGDTAFSLAPRLLSLGVIASQRAFTNAVETATTTTAGSSTGLEAGYYVLHHDMQASLAYAALTNPKNLVQTTVTIPEGKRAVDVIAIISAKTKIPLKNFQAVLKDPSELGLPSYANGNPEGYLFPATYAIVPHETALQILQAMVQRFDVEATAADVVAEAKTVGLTPSQLIIEASLAQAEGGSVSDYPKIAEVIHNRLAIGMHLQFDSTVLYGLGKYAVSATFKQVNTPGKYNTYLNAGLPPGAISNPGDAAIQGILHPAEGNWLYFLTVPNGKSQFSATPLKGQ